MRLRSFYFGQVHLRICGRAMSVLCTMCAGPQAGIRLRACVASALRLFWPARFRNLRVCLDEAPVCTHV